MRRLIIATKYGYFRPEDLERLCLPAPDWDNDKTIRRLVGQGWLRPYNFPGIIEDEALQLPWMKMILVYRQYPWSLMMKLQNN